jgi:hypothetical protein
VIAANAEIKDAAPVGPFAGTYRWIDESKLTFSYPAGTKSPRLPDGDYRVTLTKQRVKGIDKDRGGPRFKDFDRFKLTLVSENPDVAKGLWELTREGD